MDMSGIVKMFHCYSRGEINLFQQARKTCSIVCVLRLSLIHISIEVGLHKTTKMKNGILFIQITFHDSKVIFRALFRFMSVDDQ